MSNTLVPQNNNTGVDKIEMLSTEVVDLINGFRAEEGNKKVLRHKNFIASTKREIEALENAGVEVGGLNIKPAEYIDSQGKKRPCYKMGKQMILQMCNKESALVRFKTQQYIEALENRLKQQQISTDQIAQMINEALKTAVAPLIDRIEKLTAPKEAPKTRTANFRTLPTVTKIAKPFGMTGTDANKTNDR